MVLTHYGAIHFMQKYGISLEMSELENLIQIKESSLEISDLFPPEQLGFYNEMLAAYCNKAEFDLSIFKKVELILSGQLEEIWNGMEKKRREALVKVPIVDYYEEVLFNSIIYTAQEMDVPVVQKAFWPEGKKFAVCLTHDVDEIRKTYQYITHSLRCLKSGDFKGLKNQFISLMEKMRGKEEPYWTFEEIMSLERRLDVKSTFYFLKETGKVKLFNRSTWRHYGRRYDIKDEKVAELIRTLHSGGWEVGLHGSFYSYNDLDKLKKERELLEEVLGAKVYGIRQHNLNLDIPNTWRHQEEAGLEYDTTLGFNDCVGFRWGTCIPFHPFDKETGKPMELLEIPLAIEDIALFRYEDPWEVCAEMINIVERYGGVLTILWHHSVFNELEYPGWAEMYERIINVCEEKNAWITSAEEIARWWKKREESKLDYEYEDNTLRIVPYPKNRQHFINVYLPQDLKKVEAISANAEIIGEAGNSVTIRTKNLNKNEEILLEMR